MIAEMIGLSQMTILSASVFVAAIEISFVQSPASTGAVEESKLSQNATTTPVPDLDKLFGQPADIAPSAYHYRSDRPAQENQPETEFLFRTLGHGKAGVLCGLLWEEPRAVKRMELYWPGGAKPVPQPNEINLRWLPIGRSASWWYRDAEAKPRVVNEPEVSSDGRTFIYLIEAVTNEAAMDNLVVSIKEEAKQKEPHAVPIVRVLTADFWKRMDITIEWGFQSGTENLDFDGHIEAYNGILGRVTALENDAGTKITAIHSWQSRKAGESRRGITTSLWPGKW